MAETELTSGAPEATPLSVPSSSAAGVLEVDDLDNGGVQITGMAAPLADSAKPSAAEGELCAHCTRIAPISMMQNYGCKTYPKWRCRPCHTSVRALERASKSKGEPYYKKFCEMRRQHPFRFTDLVLQCRISPEGEEPLPGQDEGLWKEGCRSLQDRKERTASICKSVFSLKALEEYEDVRFLTERQFKAWMKYGEDMTSSEAQNAWDKALVSGEVEKKHLRDGTITVAVQTAIGMKTFSQRGSKRSFQTVSDVDDSEGERDGSADPENSAALKRLKAHAAGDIGNFIKQPGQDLQSKVVSVPPAQKTPSGGGSSVREVMRTLAGGGKQSSASGEMSASKGAKETEPEWDDIPGDEEVKHMGLTKARCQTSSENGWAP